MRLINLFLSNNYVKKFFLIGFSLKLNLSAEFLPFLNEGKNHLKLILVFNSFYWEI